jgi:two-component system, cell cycle sensor histidine kinase DivJ
MLTVLIGHCRVTALSLRLIASVLRFARDRGASACRDVTGTVSFLTPIRNYVDALVPVAVQGDPLAAARYRAFILPRLMGSLAALASLPVYLVLRGVPNAIEIAVFSWLVTPILIVYFLVRTGRYQAAHILSSLSLSALVVLVALSAGGIGSFAAIWLVIVPLEAALSGSRRVVWISSAFSMAAGSLLLMLGMAGVMRPNSVDLHETLAALAIASALLYATGLALGAVSLARTGAQLLGAEESRYRLLIQNMTDAVIRCGKGGSVIFASPAAQPLLGTPVTELVGTELFERVHVADRPAFLATLADAASFGDMRSLEFRIQRNDGVRRPGRFVWIEMRCRPFECESGGHERTGQDVVAILRDISERKAQDDAFEVVRLESKRANADRSRIIATVGHELRTPLNAIIGFSEMLTKSVKINASDQVEYAKLINDSGRHLLSVVNGMLDASKIEAGHFELARERFVPGPAIENCVDLLALQAREEGIEIRLRIAQILPEIAADKRAFNQILINLISNAIKFTPRGGCVTIGALCDGPKLVVTVEDTGVGIEQDDLARLGEAFFQASTCHGRKSGGSGLGLSIVKGLVRLHEGEVDIRSRVGEGTRVTVRLPIGKPVDRTPTEPIKLVTESHRDNLCVSNDWVKKSA